MRGASGAIALRFALAVSDLVVMLEQWEAEQGSEPLFDVDEHKIDRKPFVRVTFPDGKEETIYGFNIRGEAIRWIKCEAVCLALAEA